MEIKKIAFPLLFLLLLTTFVYATVTEETHFWNLDGTTDLGTATNITFPSAGSNSSVYSRVQKNYTVMNFAVNVSGYNPYLTWTSNNSRVLGLGDIGDHSYPAICNNCTGDGNWTLISGNDTGLFTGFYWNGSGWSSKSASIAGLGDIGIDSAPAICNNCTGDGNWTLISGEGLGVFKGFYWNGTKWINDNSRVLGLGDIGDYADPSICNNCTGDGNWTLITGEGIGVFTGFYWNGSGWSSKSASIAGLGDIGDRSAPAICNSCTGDGNWTLIIGNNTGLFTGFYWNGTKWINDNSRVLGLGGIGSYLSPAICNNCTGDGEWTLIAGGDGGTFYGFYFGNYPTNLSLDINNDSTNEWNMTGELNPTNSPQLINITNMTAFRECVATQDADANGFVFCVMKVTSATAGIAGFDAFSMNSTYNPPPNLTFIPSTLADNNFTTNDYVEVNVSADENVSIGTLEFDGTNYTMDCNYTNETFTYCFYNVTSISPDGTYTYTVYINDTWGRMNTTERTVKVDSKAPPITIHSPLNTTYNNTNIYFHANGTDTDEDGWSFWLTIDGSNVTDNITYTENSNVSIKNYLSIDKTYMLLVWASDTTGNENQTNVTFTINATQGVVIEPPSPSGGDDGGYDVDLNFTTDITSGATVEAYQPFLIRARLEINDTSVDFEIPHIVLDHENRTVGTWTMHYLHGGDNNVTYERTISLPPGEFVYYIEVDATNGVTYYSSEHYVKVYVPSDQNLTNLTLPSYAYGGILITFTDATTPRSHDKILRSQGVVVSGVAEKVNGTLSKAKLFILTEEGGSTIATVDLNTSDNGDGVFSLFGWSAIPAGHTRVTIQLGVEDSGGSAAWSVTRTLVVLDEDEDHIIKKGFDLFGNILPTERGSPEIPRGRILAATLIMLAMCGVLFATGAGSIPSVATVIIFGISFGTFGWVPGYVSITLVLILAIFLGRFLINLFAAK